jgi:hypothetical protein
VNEAAAIELGLAPLESHRGAAHGFEIWRVKELILTKHLK